MSDIKALVKKLLEEGESEDVIAAVIRKMEGSDIKSGLPDMSPALPAPPPRDEYTGTDTFWGGVLNSFKPGGDVDQASWKSLKGFAKGTADLGATFADTAQGLASGVHSLIQDPAAHFRAMPEAFREMGRGMRDVTMNAGADPEAFGHMSGQLFGQPAFTEGIVRAPAITKATTGAINRIPAVNKTFSSVGKALEGTRDPKILPASSRGLVAGAVRGAARPIGRALSRVGERGRLDAGTRPPSRNTSIKLKGETVEEAAARTTPNKPPNEKVYAGGGQGATRNRPVRHDTPDISAHNSEFTRPITETAEELAARKRPSAFSGGQSRRSESRPFEPRPVDTTPYPRPGAIPEGIPGEAPIVRDTTPYEPPPARPSGLPPEPPPIDPFATPTDKIPLKGGRLKQNRRNQSPPYEPSVDPFAPPTTPPIGVGEGGLSSRYQHRPYEPGQQAAANVEVKPKTAPPAIPAEPIPDLTKPVAPPRADSAFGQVDTTTGEITPPPPILRGKKLQGKWNRPNPEPDVPPNEFDFGPDEPGVDLDPTGSDVVNDSGRQFAEEVEGSRYPGDEAYDLGEISPGFRQTSSMPDWGPPQRTIQPSEWGDWGGLEADIPTLVPDASGSHVARPGVNPLRPEVPPGQVTNRSMFERSETRGMENRIANQNTAGRRFAEEVSPAGPEFSEDMLLTPAEQIPADIPPMRSPVENQYDPRISNIDQPIPNEGPAEFSGRRTIDTADDAGRGRDVRWDAETESYFDRNTRNWDDVTDATPEEIARAKGINTGETIDPTGPTPRYGTNLDITALDRTEVNKRGQGQSRLNSMFGEDTAQRLNSGESSIGPSKEGPARRELGKKQLDKSEQATWNSWGDEYLDGVPSDPNKPGLHIYDSGDLNGPFKIVYRDARGNPIGTLETGQFNTKGIANLAVNSKLGLGRGNVAFKMIKEAIDRGITEATGPTSGMTKNIIERVQRVIKDSRNRGTSHDEGMFGNAELELEINKILDGTDSPEFSSTPNESMGFSGDDIFASANDEGAPGRLVKKGEREKNFPSVIPEGFEKVGKGREIGPKGVSHRIKGPNGKHLGDINITPKQIAEIKAMEQYSHYTNEDVAKMIYDDQLEDLLIKHGYDIHEPKITSEPKTTRTKDIPLTPREKPMPATATGPIPEEIPAPAAELPENSGMYKIQTEEGVEFPNDTLAVRPPANAGLELRRSGSEIPIGSEGRESMTDFSGQGAPIKTKPSAFDTSTKVELNPDVDFGPGGDIKPIVQEARRLTSIKAADSKYRKLLPKIMQEELGPGETWRGKLDRLITEIQGEPSPEEGFYKMRERDAYLEAERLKLGREELPTEIVNGEEVPIPRLTRKVINATEMKPGKINQQRDPWLSPKTWQDHPDFARRMKAQYAKNKK